MQRAPTKDKTAAAILVSVRWLDILQKTMFPSSVQRRTIEVAYIIIQISIVQIRHENTMYLPASPKAIVLILQLVGAEGAV